MSHTFAGKQRAEDGDKWDKFCRLCFSEVNGMVQLFPDDKSPNRDLLWKILECTTLELTVETDDAARVCQECIQVMTDFCHFRMQCLQNEKQIVSRRLWKRTLLEITINPDRHHIIKNSHDNNIQEACSDSLEAHEESLTNEVDDEYQADEMISSVKQEISMVDDNLMSYVVDNDSVETDNTSDKFEQVKKKRTRKILLYDDHTYQLLSSRPKCNSITWGCVWRKSKGCKGTISTRANGLILGNVIPQHNHPPEHVDIKQNKLVIIQAFRNVEHIYLDEPYEIIKNRIGADMLIYNGDRYSYSHSRKDSCRIWKCSSHRKCKVCIYLRAEGRIFKLANREHSIEKIQQKRIRILNNAPTVSDISSTIEELYPNPVGTFNYKIVKNANKRNVLIYEGDRYTFYYKKTNGWTVWRCTVSKGCLAMIYQLSDDSVAVLGDIIHNHMQITNSS